MNGLLPWIAGFALMLSGWLVTIRAVAVCEEEESPADVTGIFLHCLAAFMVITGAMLWRVA